LGGGTLAFLYLPFFYSVFPAPAALFIRVAHGATDLHQFGGSERIIILATATPALSTTPAACAIAPLATEAV